MEERVPFTRESDTLHAYCIALLPTSLQLLCLQSPTLARRRRQRPQRRTGSISRTTRRGMSEWSRNSQLLAGARRAAPQPPAPAIGICDLGTDCPQPALFLWRVEEDLVIVDKYYLDHVPTIPKVVAERTKCSKLHCSHAVAKAAAWIRLPVHLTPLCAGMLRRS